MTQLLTWLFGVTERDLAGADSWTVRFTGVPESIWALLGLLVLFAALVALTVRSYRREGDAPFRAKALPAGLRIGAIVALFAIIFQPAIILKHKKVLPSTVVVLADDSLSMRWADRLEDEAERTALAKFLDVDPAKLVGPDRMTREEIVRRALSKQDGPVAALAVDHPILLLRFSTDAPGKEAYTQVLASMDPLPLPEKAANEKPKAPGARPALPELPPTFTAGVARLQASGFETNLARAVREAAQKVEGRRVAAMVVLSDGRSTGSESGGRLASSLDFVRQRGIPIYAVAVGDPTPPKNIAVLQLQAPSEIRKGASAVFTTFLTHRHMAGTSVTVELWQAKVATGAAAKEPEHWEKTGVSETVTLKGGEAADDGAGDIQEVPMSVTPEETGRFVYKARVEPRDEELIKTDNEAVATVKVSDEKVTVLLVSGDGSWEFQYLRNYLLRHPEHYKVSAWQQNTDVQFNQESSSPDMRRGNLPRTREDLFAYDVVILYDPRHTANGFDGDFVELVSEFVSKHHGGVCYLAGNKFTDMNLLATDATFKALRDLLPVVLERDATPFAMRLSDAGRTAWPVKPTAEGADHPLMQMDPSAEENERVWRLLPGIFWSHPVAQLKTLASALAVSGDPGRQTVDGQREPVLAVQYYGKGRVLYLGFDGTWRWRYLKNAFYYDKFWGNTIDFLAAGRLEKKRVVVTTGGTSFDTGSEIRVRVEAYDREFEPLKAPSLKVRLVNTETGEATEHVLQAAKRGAAGEAAPSPAAATRDGLFEGVILANRTGTFEVRPAADAGGDAGWTDEDVATRRIEIHLPQEEFRRPEADFKAMRELADEDARFLRAGEMGKLADLIPPGKVTSVSETPRPIWNSLPALLLVGFLLLAEWIVRKVYNMA